MTTSRRSETLRDDIDYGASETPNSEIALRTARLGPLSALVVSGAHVKARDDDGAEFACFCSPHIRVLLCPWSPPAQHLTPPRPGEQDRLPNMPLSSSFQKMFGKNKQQDQTGAMSGQTTPRNNASVVPEDAAVAEKGEVDHSKPKIFSVRVFTMALIVSIGGLIFGYDTGQISGFLEDGRLLDSLW